MTDDITRGLALLADEAEPGPIDSHAVIAQARARTRNRRTVAAAFLAVVAIGALAVTASADRPASDVAEQPELPSQRLNAQLAAAVAELIPTEWEAQPAPPYDGVTPKPDPLVFSCGKEPRPVEPPRAHGPQGTYLQPVPLSELSNVPPPEDWCNASAYYRDAKGEIEIWFTVTDRGNWTWSACPVNECSEWVLADGTRVRAAVAPEGYPQRQMESLRPDGTVVQVVLNWQNEDRSEPPLTVDEQARFLDRFDY